MVTNKMMDSQRLQQIQKMLESEPSDSFLNYALALEYAKSGNVIKAIELIESLLLRDENYLGAYYQCGKYYEQIKKSKEGIEKYKKGIAIAKLQNNTKAERELNEALLSLDTEKK